MGKSPSPPRRAVMPEDSAIRYCSRTSPALLTANEKFKWDNFSNCPISPLTTLIKRRKFSYQRTKCFVQLVFRDMTTAFGARAFGTALVVSLDSSAVIVENRPA